LDYVIAGNIGNIHLAVALKIKQMPAVRAVFNSKRSITGENTPSHRLVRSLNPKPMTSYTISK
jgi:hypothetical protein